jgi:hypothetical protein
MQLRRQAAARLVLAAVTLLAVLPASASARELAPAPLGLFDGTLTSTDKADRPCHERLAPGRAGVVQRRATAPSEGIVAATLKASGGDWDLAVFDRKTGYPLAQATGARSDELATGFVGAGREVVLQACRRTGSSSTARVTLSNTAVKADPTPEKAQLVDVSTPTRPHKDLLNRIGVDVTEHGDADSLGVVLYGKADEQLLRENGFTWKVEIPNLMANDAADRLEDAKFAAATRRSALPSGRDDYRNLAAINEELKAFAKANPNLVKLITLKEKSLEGRTVYGIEVTKDVNTYDGKPVFLQLGVHHAREWPSVEMPMEFANELIRGYGKDQRITNLLSKARVIFVPVVNVDGYNLSKNAPYSLDPVRPIDQVDDSCDLGNFITGACLGYSAALLADPNFAYKRRNCRTQDGRNPAPGECGIQAARQLGVDPNRNYGGLWGGPGASPLPSHDTYRGAGPFSEPETRNIQDLVSKHHVVTLITNHTFSNLVLRPPGVKAQGKPVDDVAMAALGKAMTDQNGYTNQTGYELYDTTGTTEDWSYSATGGFGYTFEIGPEEFHPPYPKVIEEYLGKKGTPTEGKGNREAYFKALEHTVNATQHSIVSGTAPKGAVLRISKEFLTETSPVVQIVGPPGEKRSFKDSVRTRMTAPGGRFEWHTNPSTRPDKMAERKVTVQDKTPSRVIPIAPKKQTEPGVDDPVDLVVGPDYGPDNYDEFTFSIRPEDDVALLKIPVDVADEDDYDLELYKKNGRDPVETSGHLIGEDEEIILEDPPLGDYVLRVNNYLASSPWKGSIQFFKPGKVEMTITQRESFNLTCETPSGKLLNQTKVVVDRGQRVDTGALCGEDAPAIIAQERSRTPVACASTAGFRSTSARPVSSRRRVRLGFARRVAAPVRVDIFQVSRGRRILGNLKVAAFTGRRRPFTWNGRTNTGRRLTDGVYFVRYRVRGLKKVADFRRHVLVRRKGKWSSRRSHYARESCGMLYSTKLERPVFGGRANLPQFVVFRVRRRSNVTVTISRGKRVVRVMRTNRRAARRTHRLRFPAERARRRGIYTFKITARSGGRAVTKRLYAERL